MDSPFVARPVRMTLLSTSAFQQIFCVAGDWIYAGAHVAKL
jgi:hypothetical protein